MPPPSGGDLYREIEMLKFNTDDIKRIVDSLVIKEIHTDAMIQGYSLTIYPEREGRIRILAHKPNKLNWIGYWFKKEPAIEELEAMLKDSETYTPRKIEAAGSHFYYSGVDDKVKFVVGVETLQMGAIADETDDFFDEIPLVIKYPWQTGNPRVRLEPKPIVNTLLGAMSEVCKDHYKKVYKDLLVLINDPKKWEQKPAGLYLTYPHRLGSLDNHDIPLFAALLRRQFIDVADHVLVYHNNIVLEISL